MMRSYFSVSIWCFLSILFWWIWVCLALINDFLSTFGWTSMSESSESSRASYF